MRLEIRNSHLTFKVANKRLNACEQLEVLEWNKDGPLLCPAVLRVASVLERKP